LDGGREFTSALEDVSMIILQHEGTGRRRDILVAVLRENVRWRVMTMARVDGGFDIGGFFGGVGGMP